MRDSFVLKRLICLLLSLTVISGIVFNAPADEVFADTDGASVTFTDADLVSERDIYISNGIYRIYSKDSAAFMGLLNPNVESFTVPNLIKYQNVSYKVIWIAQSAFEGNTTVKSVYIGKNVNRICSRAFYGCTALKSITGGKGVTYTASDAYDECPVLKKPGLYYKGTYNVGTAYIGKAPKPWRKNSAGRNGKGEMTWITENDLKVLGKTRGSFGNEVLAACRKMAGTVYTNDMDCISYCLSSYAKALGVATSVGKGKSFRIKFAKNLKNSKTKHAVNIMKKAKVINVSGSSISRNGANWFHCTNFAEHLLSKPNCYGGVKVSDYKSLGDCMKALNAQPGDIVLFGGYVSTYLCKDGKYYKTNFGAHGGKKKVNGHYVRGEGNLFVWGHAAVYAGYSFTHADSKGKMRNGQWFYETSNKVKAGLHWREPYYTAQGNTNQRVMVIHIGNPKASDSQGYTDPVQKVMGSDAVNGAKYGIYRSEEDAAADNFRLATVTCGAGEEAVPFINLGSASRYDVGSGNKVSARLYMRQLSDNGTAKPDAKTNMFRMRALNTYDVPSGWLKLSC